MKRLVSLLPALAIAACFLLSTGWLLGWAVVATSLAVSGLAGYYFHMREVHGCDPTQASMEVLFPLDHEITNHH